MNDVPEEVLFIILSHITTIKDLLNFRCSWWGINKLSTDGLLKDLYISFLDDKIADRCVEDQLMIKCKILAHIDKYKLITHSELFTLLDFKIITNSGYSGFNHFILFVPHNLTIGDFLNNLKDSSYYDLNEEENWYFIFRCKKSSKVLAIQAEPPVLIRGDCCWDVVQYVHNKVMDGDCQPLLLNSTIEEGMYEIYELLNNSFHLMVGIID